MAYCAGKEALRRELVFFARAVAVYELDFFGARHGALLALHRKAALGADLLTLRIVDFGIDKLEKALFDVYYDDARVYSYLGRGEPRAVLGTDGRLHIVEKSGKLPVEIFDFFADFAQNGVAHLHHESL